jgi:hypothetical protein
MASNKRWRWPAGCLLMVLLPGLLASAAIAQPPPPLPQSGGAVDADTSADQTPADGATAADGPSAGEPDVRRLYVPTERLDAVLRGDRQGVLLPKEEFRRLYEAARAADETEVHTPGGIVVTSARFEAQLADEQLQMTASVKLTQFERGWQVVRLPMAGLSLQSARLDDQPAAVARDGEQRSVLLLFSDTTGEHTLRLELTTPLNALGSDRLAEFQTLGAPAGLLTLEVPEGKSLLVDGLRQSPSTAPGGAVSDDDNDDGGDDRDDSEANRPKLYRVALGGRGRVSLRLTDRDLRHAADALVFASTAYGLQVAPGEVTWSTQTSVQAWGQGLSRLTFTVPRELEVASVESTGLEEWTLGETGGRNSRTQITLNYRQPFEGERTVTIRGVLVPDSQEWTVPDLVLENADSHAATIIVKHGPEVRLQSEHGEEVRPVSGTEPRTLQFQTMDAAFDLQFRTLGKARSVQVAQTNLLDVGDDGLDLHVVMDVDTWFVPLFDVRVLLPAEFEVTSAVVGDREVEWSIGNGPPGVIEVRIPLEPPLPPGETARVRLSAHADPEDWPVENTPVLLPFPEVQLPQADMVEARYGIIADEDLEVRTSELTGLDPARQADVQGLQEAARRLGKSLRLGFSYQDTVFSGQLEVTRKPTRLAVSTLALSRLDPQRVHTGLQAFVTVEGGGTEGLLIELPENTGTDLRFSVRPATPLPANVPASRMVIPSTQPVAIVEQSVAAPAAGVRTWALRFDRRMRGNHVLQVTLNQPRTAGEDVTLPAPRFVGAERQNGWIAVEARPEQNLQVQALSADAQPLLRVDPVDLPGMAVESDAQRRIVAGVRYVQPGYTVTVTEQTFDPRAVPTALADRITTTSVLSLTGLLQHQLDVTFRAVGMQSLRFVLPPGADVWAVLIDGKPVEVRQAQNTYQVPLTGREDPTAARSLRLIYRSRVERPQLGGRLRQSPPVIAAVSGSGQTQPLEVLQQSWTLHYPNDVVLLKSRGLLTPTGELVQDSWLARIREAITLPTLAQAGWRVGLAAAVAVVIAGISLLVRRLEGWTLALIVVVPILGVLLIALLLPSVQQSREAATPSSRVGSAVTQPEPAMAFDMEMPAPAGAESAPTDSPARSRFGEQFEQAAPPPMAEPQAPMDDPFAQPQRPQAGTPIGPAGAQQQAGQAEGERPAGEGVTMALPPARGALLSLSLDLQAPEGSRSQTFETLAGVTDQPAPLLDVSYGSRSFREVIVLCLAAGLALVLWVLRNASLKARLAIVLVTIVLPLAIAPITPPRTTMVVEGVLLGGIAGAGLWLLRALVALCCACCGRWCPTAWTTRTSPGATTSALLIATLLTLGGAAEAQERSPSDAPQKPAGDDERPTVVVPYDNGDPLAAERVFLPQELFRKLWLKANPDQQPKVDAPVAALVAEALYAIDATGEPRIETDGQAQLRVNGRMVLFALADKPVWVPLPLQQVAIASGTIDGEDAVLRPGENGRPEVLLPAAGVHVLDLEFDLAAELRNTSGSLTLPLLPVAAGSLSLTLPAAEGEREIRVLVDGRQVVGSRVTTTDEGQQQIAVAVDQGGPLQITWQPRAQSGGSDNIVHVTTRSAIDIGDAGVQMTADYQLQVRQGVLSRVPFAFPESVRLKRITGQDVGGWQIEGEGDERTLTIFLRRNVDDATTITAELFLPQGDRSDAFDLVVPAFAPLQVTRETGDVAVLAGSHLEVRTTAAEDLRQIDRGEAALPQSLAEARERVQLAYRFVMRPWSLELAVNPEAPEVRARAEHGVSIGLRKTRYASRLVFELSGAPRRTLRVLIGEEFLLTSVNGEAITDWFVENGELVLDFGQPRTGRIEVALEGHLPRDPADTAAVIITPLPLELDRQESLLAVWVDAVYAATLDAFETWRTIDREQLPAELRQLQSAAPQFALRSSAAEPELVNLNVARQQPQITADAVTLIALSDVSVDYGLTLRWTIERAATDLLSFTVPSWLQDRLEITGEAIRQTTQTLTEDGRVRWTVQLTDAVRGEYLLSAIATLPPPGDNQIAAPDVGFEQPPVAAEGQYVRVDAQQSFAVLVNLSRGRLTPAGNVDDLVVRREQLPLVLRDDLLAQAMAIVRVPPQRQPVWNLQRASEGAAQAAQVTAAELTSVLAMDGSLRTLARYRVRNRGQQYLALQLPESARILSVLVKGEPARGLSAAIGDVPVTLIPLPQTSAADLSFLVEVVLADRLAGVSRLDRAVLGQVLDLPAPQVISSLQSAEFGMPVVHTTWTVWLPEDFDAEIDTSRTRGTPRSNLTPQPARAAEVMSELQLYRELEDLNRLVIDEKVTAAQRSKAATNIDLLQKQLSSRRTSREWFFDKSGTLAPQDRDFAGRTDELLKESAFNVQQAQQQLQRGGILIVEDPGNTNYIGKSFIMGNSAQIFTDNAGRGVVQSEERFNQFRLGAAPVDRQQASDKKEAGKAADSRAELRGRLQSQQLALPAEPSAPAIQQAQPGMGIGGGAFGGGAFGPAQADDMIINFGEFDADAGGGFTAALLGAPAEWLQAGGLSLPIDLPKEGQSLTFTKLGGDPRLALQVRPRETAAAVVHWVWAIIVLAAGAWLLHHIAHRTDVRDLRSGLVLLSLALGLALLLLLPLPLSLAGGALFIAGAVFALLNWNHPAETTRE